jgi:hypothetical protein
MIRELEREGNYKFETIEDRTRTEQDDFELTGYHLSLLDSVGPGAELVNTALMNTKQFRNLRWKYSSTFHESRTLISYKKRW